jgi:SMC interacting uncharacterized protein involved in chromosome segregation
MTEEQYQQFREEIKSHIQDTIKVTVNGKIDRLKEQVAELSNKVEPAVELVTNLKGFNKVMWYFLGIVGTVAGIIFGYLQIKIK